ncbi:peroxidase-related enzyme [Viridibacillus sp. NPDC093762]|uniref:peroxidase-related enzyme n=1 Tax=Viridibacillus sp. NPDC093762 TaxID=3390720 RepID=UPI003D01D5AE
MSKYTEQLSYLQNPDEKDIPVELQIEFDKHVDFQQEHWGFINNLFKILPLNPLQYKGFLDFKNTMFDENTCYLNNLDKEMMGLVVSSTNCCAYCLTTHSDALRGLTGDATWVDQLTYNYRSATLTKKQRALCDYAYYVTTYPQETTQQQVELLRLAGFNDHEILEASFIAGFFNFTNRWVSTIGAVPNPGHFNHNR